MAYAADIEVDKNKRKKSRSFRPLLRLWPFAAKYPGQMALFLLFLALSTMMTLGLSFVIRGITDCGFANADQPAYCSRFSTDGSGSLSTIFFVVASFAIAFAIISSTRAFLINNLGQRIVADIRNAVYAKLVTLSPSYFERVRTGEVVSRLTTDTTLVETVVTGSISFAIRSVATTIGALVVMFIVSWKLSLMVLAIGPLIIVPAVVIGKQIKKYSMKGQDTLAMASARASESLSNIQTVQAYTREDFECENFVHDVNETFLNNRTRLIIRAFLMTFIMAMAMTSLAAIVLYGASTVRAGTVDGGAILQFAFLAFLVVSNTGMLSETWTNLLRAAGASQRLSEILDEEPDIKAPADPLPLTRAEGHIEFDHVSFSYPKRPDTKAIDDVSFNIKPGETVALVGPSGAGKTTIFQLLLRFYDVQSGTISVDDAPITRLDPTDLRQQFAIVQQSTPLFSGTAMDNIRYGRAGATDEDVIAAAEAANADEFISKLPNGYQTDLGEKALTLSGGQKQRIAIARAILRDAPILLLDEATSALDAQSEKAVQAAFARLSEGRTTLVIAHRLATVLRADRILVLDEGRLIDEGTHDELVKNAGLYANLAELQFSQD